MPKKTLEIIAEYDVCTHYLSAIINGDYSGLEDNDEKDLNEFLDRLPKGATIDIQADSHNEFTRDEVTGLHADCETIEIWDWVAK